MNDLLFALGLVGGTAGIVAGVMVALGHGGLLLGLVNNRFVQGAIAVGAAVLAVLAIREKARREGATAEREAVQRENARAVERRRKIETEVEMRSDDELRDKLRRYSRD